MPITSGVSFTKCSIAWALETKGVEPNYLGLEPGFCQSIFDARVMRKAHTARLAATTKPIHDANIGIDTPAT